jgi:hypothetical protein
VTLGKLRATRQTVGSLADRAISAVMGAAFDTVPKGLTARAVSLHGSAPRQAKCDWLFTFDGSLCAREAEEEAADAWAGEAEGAPRDEPARRAELDTSTSDRKLTIFSYGHNVHTAPEGCEVTFDLRDFACEYDSRAIREGRPLGSDSARDAHPSGLRGAVRGVVESIERDAPASVAFMCAWGKHRSMAWAEMLKADHYPRARVRHLRLELEGKMTTTKRGTSRRDKRAAKEVCWEGP